MSPPLVYLMRVTSSIRVGASDDLDRALCGGVGRLGRNGCGVVHRQILKLPVVAELMRRDAAQSGDRERSSL